MSEDSEIDPETLQAELEQIKDAMGLQEQYPGAFRLWLYLAVLVPCASLLSQYISLAGIPEYWHTVNWVVFMGPVWAYQWRGSRRSQRDGSAGSTKPNIFRQFVSIFALYFVLMAIFGPVMGESGEEVRIFALFVALSGTAYLIMAETMKAYHIRRRDRWAVLLGGGWMLLLAMAIPNVALLAEWGFAVFGILFAIHAIGSYVVLSE